MNPQGRRPVRIESPERWKRPSSAAPLTDEERFTEPEWREWFALTPQQRCVKSEKLWAHYLEIGGRLDPEPDTQSPFFDPDAPGAEPADGWTGLRAVRRSGV
jgi:hypothetical protein